MSSLLKTCRLSHGNRLCRYADDTYLIIPPANINTRLAELSNFETTAQANNMTKPVEIVSWTIEGIRLINRHHYYTLPASHPLRSWVWRSPTVCQSVNTSRMSSCRVHRLCMLCRHCAITAWWTHHCLLFSNRLLLPNLFTLSVLGMAFARQPTEIVSRPRHHDRLLTPKLNSTVESDFIIRMLFRDSYWYWYSSVYIIICPIATAYSMGQIIKSVCVCLSICPCVLTLTIAFLCRFSRN